VWYKTLVDFLAKLGLYPLNSNYTVFISGDRSIFLAVYMDNLLLFSLDMKRMDEIQENLSARFKMTDLGQISHYLGIEVDVIDDIITIR